MTRDFWVLTILLVIWYLISIIASFRVNAYAGFLSIMLSILSIGLILWNQHCLTAEPNTGCTVLAWLYVVFFALAVVITIGAIIVVQSIKKEMQQAQEEAALAEQRARRQAAQQQAAQQQAAQQQAAEQN